MTNLESIISEIDLHKLCKKMEPKEIIEKKINKELTQYVELNKDLFSKKENDSCEEFCKDFNWKDIDKLIYPDLKIELSKSTNFEIKDEDVW
jgi:hypothetical protein